MQPNNFILSSDYASLANDSNSQTITINIPGGVAVPLFPSVVTYSGSTTIGTRGAPMICDINYSYSNRRYKTNELQVVENATGNQYLGVIKVYRSSATEVTASVSFGRGGSAVNTNARTITVRVRTYLPPFS